jgi:molybdopterin converting factor small subunit
MLGMAKDLMVGYLVKLQEMTEHFLEMQLKEEKWLTVVELGYCVPLDHALQDMTEVAVVPKVNHHPFCQMIAPGR